MTFKEAMLLAAKDFVVLQFKWQILDWPPEVWETVLTDSHRQVCELPIDQRIELFKRYVADPSPSN